MNYLPSPHLFRLAVGLVAFALVANSRAEAPVTFEQPAYLPTTTFVANSVLKGDLHTVRPTAWCDGLMVTYTIDAADGSTYTATGTAMLYQRIAEIYAIAKLQEMDSGKEFTDSLGNGAKNTVTAIGKTISDPGKAIEGVPQGVSKFFGSLGESLKGGRSNYEGKAYNNVLGASKAKRMLAVELGVNPYSTNETLQKELNRVGWSQAGGTVTIHLATAAIPAGAGMALNLNRNAQAEVVANSPQQLDIINRKKLMAIGLSQRTADILIKGKWFSPMHRTAITEALISLGEGHGQETFLEVASRATSEVDANYFQAVAELIQKYNKDERPAGTIVRAGRTVAFQDAVGNWVFPVPFDYSLWTEAVHNRATKVLDGHSGHHTIIYTTGGLSDKAAESCDNLKLKVMDHVSVE